MFYLKKILSPLYNSNTLWNISMVLGRNVEQDQTTWSHSRMSNLPFLLLELSPFVIFDSDNPLISCPLCKSKTLRNISMIFVRNVEQDQTTCHIQE